MLTLLVIQGPDKGRRYELPDVPTLIGRDSRQIPLTDNTVSRRHCELKPEDGKWVLIDHGSANGTYVNGSRVLGSFDLKPGDQIRVGRSLMVFGTQPGVKSAFTGKLKFAGEETGMDSAIMHTLPSNEDSMVLAVPEPSAAAMTSLRLLYQLGATLGSSYEVDQVLAVVMDLVFENIKADRGIILLVDEKRNELIPKVIRSREDQIEAAKGKSVSKTAGSDSAERIHASRTIIDHVIANGEGVLSSNAMADRRFSKGKSIHDLGIRSAICVPIKARRMETRNPGEDVVGVIYIDSSVKNYTYSPDQLRLLTTIGLQAGMAIQNAQLYLAHVQAERMAAIGETTAALSHSIKNILQALRGGADVVEMGLRADNLSQAKKGWGVVERNLEKIYNLTLNLLAYSKEREPKLEPTDLKSVINDCLELLASVANQRKVMAVADVSPNLPKVPVDPDGIHQVLMNLLSNALDAVEPGSGLIRVVGRFDRENQQAVLEIIDNGSGIAEPMMDHVFELFHSTKGNRGTGLGLAVARKIVDEHEGSISVKSAPGEGTTFIIRLPIQH